MRSDSIESFSKRISCDRLFEWVQNTSNELMPLVKSDYNPPLIFRNGHISTVYSGLIRRVNGLEQVRERLELKDGDFIDLDWSYTTSATNKLLI